MRLPVDEEMRPKSGELMFMLGLPHCGVFSTFMASARS